MNNYAISTSDLAESLTRSSAALVAANNSLEQSIALTAAANTTIQDPESVGNALKVVSMRIRGVKSELEEAGEDTDGLVTNTAKLQEKIKALTNIDGKGGIDILTDSGEFKSTYDILLAISKVWKDMDDTSQAALLELVAGKTRGSVVAALFQNGDVLEDAYASAAGASGSAMRELDTYLDSIEGKMQQFNNSVQTMWMNFIDSDVVKFIVDLGTGLVKTIEKMGLLNVALIALVATLSRKQLVAGLKNLFKPGTKNIQGFIKHIGTLIARTKEVTVTTVAEALSSKGVAAARVGEILVKTKLAGVDGKLSKEKIKVAAATLSEEFANKKLTASQYLAAMSSMGLKTALQALWNVIKANPVMWISALVTVAANAFDHFHKTAVETMEETKEAFEEMRSVVESTKSTIQSLESELATIEEQLDGFEGKELSFADEQEVNRLKKQRSELQKNLDVQNEILKLQKENSNKRAIAAVKAYTKASSEGAEETRENWQNAAKWGLAAVGTIIGAVATGGASLAVQLGTMAAAGVAGYAVGNTAGEIVGSAITANSGSYDSWYRTYQDALETAREEEQKALEAYQEDTSNIDKLDKWREMQQKAIDIESEMYEHINNMQSYFADAEYGQSAEMDKALDEWNTFLDKFLIDQGSQDAKKNALDRLFGENADEVVKDYVYVKKAAIEAGESFEFTKADAETIGLDDDLKALGITIKDVTDYFTKLGKSGADAVDKIKVSDLISELEKVESALGSVQSVMEEFRTDGIVSASTLSGMQEEFGGLGKAWENYVNTMMSGTATMEDAKAATEALAKAYLDANANDINKDTRLTYIAQLEKFGNIENAAELVDSYINDSFWNSTAFKNFKGSWEELIELAEKYGVTLDENAAREIANAKSYVDNAQSKYDEKYKDWLDVKKRNDDTEKQKRDDKDKAYEALDALDDINLDEGDMQYDIYYNPLKDAITRSGEYADYSDEDLKAVIAKYVELLSNYMKSHGLKYTAEDLFPEYFKNYTLEVLPDLTVEEAEVNKYKNELEDMLDKSNPTVTPRIDMNPADTIEEISDIEGGFESLSDAYNEFLEEGVVSAKTLSGLKGTFDVVGMKDEYAEFVTTLGNSKSTIEQVKSAVLNLANAYLNTIDITDKMDESEKQMIIEQLTRLGITNAQEWVNARIEAYNQMLEAYQIDLNNYNTAEEAKAAAAASAMLGIELLNNDLVKDLILYYKDDLVGFCSGEDAKVEAAKAAAIEIAKAHRAAQLDALDATFKYEEDSNPFDSMGPFVLPAWEKRWKEKQEEKREEAYNQWLKDTQADRDAINKQYDDTVASIEALGGINVNDYINSWFGDVASIDWSKFKGLGDTSSDSSTELDWLDNYFTSIENKIKEKEADLENVISADIKSIYDTNTIIDSIIFLYEGKMTLLEKAIKAYKDRATALFNSFSKDIQNKITDGSIDISKYSGATADKIQDYFDYMTNASDLEIELGGVKVTVADLSLQKFDNASEAFDNEIEEKFQSDQDIIEAEIDYLEEQGKRVSPELYQKLIDIQKDEQKVLESKKKTLEDILTAEVAIGHIPIGSEQYYEMLNAINDVDEAIIQSKNDIESFQNAINEIHWDNFDKLIDRLDAVNSELSNLFDLLSEDDKVVDEFGNWTDEGIASLGLLAQQMENAQAKADEYAEAIKQLEEDYADGKYSLDEYNEKSAELKDNYLSEIKNIEDLKDAMVDLNKVRIDAVKKAIDKEIEALEEKNEKLKESLSLEKEQYEWQKSVAEKEKSIADIQRRLIALAGDTSASAMAEKRKLQAELAAAQAEMDDMWYEHSIEEQQKNLDESLENFKENKEDEKEALDKWLEEEEKVIQESFDLFNSNVDIVSSVLSAFEAEHGIKLTEAVTNPWNSGIDAMEAYRQKLAEMKQEQEDAKDDADDAADDIIESLDKPELTVNPKEDPPEETVEPTTPSYREYTIKKNDTLSGIAKSQLGSASRWQEIYNLNKDIIKNPNLIYPGQKIKLPHYAKGTMGAEYDHWAMVDELGPELQLVPDGSGRLSYITRGTSVIPHDLSEKLVDLALDPTKVLDQSRPKLGAPHITTNNFDIDLNFGSLVHVDHCDQNTLPDLQKMVRGEIDNMMKALNQKIKRK